MTLPTLREIPFEADSETLFARLRHLPGAVWLDSGKPRSLQGRFDIISWDPRGVGASTKPKSRVGSRSPSWVRSVDVAVHVEESSCEPPCPGTVGT